MPSVIIPGIKNKVEFTMSDIPAAVINGCAGLFLQTGHLEPKDSGDYAYPEIQEAWQRALADPRSNFVLLDVWTERNHWDNREPIRENHTLVGINSKYYIFE